MSEVKVNKISPRAACGTVTLGDSGDSFVIPAGATITNSGTQTGFGRTGAVDWQTGSIKTSTFTATSGEGYFVDTSSGAVTCNLPAGTAGAIVAFADYTRTFNTHNLTISPNGSNKIGGVNADSVLNVNGQAITLVFVDATEGWINVQNAEDTETGNPNIVATGGTVTTCGNCKIHTFTGPGTFTVSNISTTPANNEVSYLVVAGGGGAEGGGGGAGGFREVKSPTTPYTASPLDGYPNAPNRVTITKTSFPITVGGGGAAGSDPSPGGDGGDSVFSTITSKGGGGGAHQGASGSSQSGGSGGGSGQDSSASGGAGNTPPVSPPQGNNGGAGGPGPYGGSGAGGGATAVGSNAGTKISPIPGSPGSNGGAGAGTLIAPASGEGGPGPSRYYSGGGAGGSNVDANPTPGAIVQGFGGIGGGGNGGRDASSNGGSGTANTGGGAGGGEWQGNGGAGGSGIVVIRYKFQ